MLQVQSLINQRALSAPAGSTKGEEPLHGKRKSRPAQKEEETIIDVQEKPDIETEKKGSLENTCLNCGELFTSERSTRKFCSGKCKTAYYRKKSKEKII